MKKKPCDNKQNIISRAFYVLSMEGKIQQNHGIHSIWIYADGQSLSFDDYQKIKSASRKRTLTEYKFKYAVAAIESGYTLGKIEEHIVMSTSVIRDMLNRYYL